MGRIFRRGRLSEKRIQELAEISAAYERLSFAEAGELLDEVDRARSAEKRLRAEVKRLLGTSWKDGES